jgi:ribonuclease HI
VSTVSAQELREVEIIIDGSCLGNPGPGGWACILRCGEHERVLQGGVPDATNNRMELAAAIEGLRALKRACQVTVLTDSEYVRRGITEFLPRWRSNGWRNASGKAVANQDLWEQLEELAGYHAVTWVHVRGHSGQPDHERCDALAISAARAARRATAIA